MLPLPHWTIETVPAGFWRRIEAAEGRPEVFVAALADLDEPALREVYSQYKGLMEALVKSCFAGLAPDLREESVETLELIANWIITQGEARYRATLADPSTFPRRGDIRRPMFAGHIVMACTDRFGRWRPDA